jgi:hypothetical protein
MRFAFTVRLDRAFLTIDGLGVHAGWRGREVAYTREFGWVFS